MNMDPLPIIHATLFAAASLHILLPLRPHALGRMARRAIATFKEWRRRARSRRELSRLDEYQLKDIGLTTSQASFETGKSFLQY
jgi:uncharacterized protein YjiS (DUF1127 family)